MVRLEVVYVNRGDSDHTEIVLLSHNGRRAVLIEARIASINAASALTNDAGIIEPCSLYVLALVKQLRTILFVIDGFDKEIERVASALPDYAL